MYITKKNLTKNLKNIELLMSRQITIWCIDLSLDYKTIVESLESYNKHKIKKWGFWWSLTTLT